MTEVGGVEIHIFVDVSEVGGRSASARLGGWGVGAAEDVREGLVEVGEEAAVGGEGGDD